MHLTEKAAKKAQWAAVAYRQAVPRGGVLLPKWVMQKNHRLLHNKGGECQGGSLARLRSRLRGLLHPLYDAVVTEAAGPRGGYPPADVALMPILGQGTPVALFVHGP